MTSDDEDEPPKRSSRIKKPKPLIHQPWDDDDEASDASPEEKTETESESQSDHESNESKSDKKSGSERSTVSNKDKFSLINKLNHLVDPNLAKSEPAEAKKPAVDPVNSKKEPEKVGEIYNQLIYDDLLIRFLNSD